MSAIAGLYRRDGRPVDAGDVKPMIECLAHRGPGADGRRSSVRGIMRASSPSTITSRTGPWSLRPRSRRFSASGKCRADSTPSGWRTTSREPSKTNPSPSIGMSIYRDVYRLHAGNAMTVRRDEVRVQPYCSLDPTREIRLRSDDEYAKAFRERFTQAVRCRLRSAFPVGSLLSGGLDSSSMGTARKVLGQDRLHTFSAIFPGLPQADLRRIDERPFIEAVHSMGGVTPHYVRGDQLSPLTDLDRVSWHEDEAVLAPNLYMHWALYGAAQRQGVRVLLDGVDGDTTVSHGLEYLSELVRTGKARTLVREIMAFAKRHKSPAASVPWQVGVKPLVPESMRRVWRAMRRTPSPRAGSTGSSSPSLPGASA
jgi:asparagine synthetase B (glutamine-hydrolysing)